jgi:localization factor PodJL
MKFGFPWNVKGIRQHAQQTAQEAARRAGMPLSDWLNAIILQQAATQGIRVPSLPRSSDEGTADHLTGVHQRLDDLTRRIDQVTRSGSAPYAPKRDREEPDQFAELFARLEQRFDQFAAKIPRPSTPHAADNIYPPGLVSAIAEIAARHRPLHAAAAPAPAPAQDLSGLEGQLRRITDQIETLRRPGVEEAIAALHVELREISHTLAEAMPRRAIETIEIQIQRLTQRLADGRQAGADGNALAGIEYGLAEVRDALHALTPAENLVGYTDAIDALRHKIDLIVAQKDPATMQRLETSIGALREMAAHVASNEAMTGLYAQVQALADKIDHLAISGGGDALNRLELRIDALSRTLADRAQSGDIPPRLEVLMQSLSEKIEQLQPLRGDQIAVAHLEDRIVRLFERLDATDSRLSQLDAVERGLTDLLVHIEDIRVNKETGGFRAESAPDIDLLRQDIARTHGALEAVNGTLDRVADRLTVIEGDIRGNRPGPAIREPDVLELTQFSDKAATQEITVAPEIAPRPQPNSPLAISVPLKAPQPALPLSVDFPNLGLRPVASAPSDPDLPVDVPLEPGSGRPGLAQSPGMRIAASEAALGGVQPNMATAGGKSNFIAAARRAAQAAGQDPNGRQRSEPLKAKGDEQGSLRTRVQTRVTTLFLAASIVAIIIGSIQFASNIFDFGIFNTREARLATASEMDAANSEIAADTAELETSAALAESQPTSPTTRADTDIIASLLAPPPLPSLAPATPPPPVATAPPSSNLNSAEQLSSALNLPMLSPSLLGPTPKGDVTGSIVPAPADTRSNRQPAQTAQPPAADGLPAAIGGARLRNAASAGDPAAAYEIAMRFVEGRGVPANLEEAARWFERAANKGLAPAQFRYASMLEKGLGVKKDLVVANKLYVAAAGKGHAKAMHNLAVLYAEGAEGKPDYVNAAQWFRKAAERGVADSQFNLGVLTVRGLGTEKNIAESYKWFALAAAQGDRDAGRKRDEVAGYLNAETLAAAQEAVKSFAAKPQPAEATMVPQPSGGWDRATSPPPEKPRAAGPLSISAFNSGKL